MKDFKISNSNTPIHFKIDGDEFVAVAPAKLPAMVTVQYSETVAEGKMMKAHIDFFKGALEKESADRFLERLSSSENPISLQMMAEVIEWLAEQYAGKSTA